MMYKKNELINKICFTYFIFFNQPVTALETQLIENATFEKNRITIKINHDFKKKYLHDDFFVEYENNIDLEKLDESILLMPFIMNIITIVWASGEKYTISSMDKELFNSLQLIKKIFQLFYPSINWHGELIPQKLVENKPLEKFKSTEKEIALLFSGGLDSVCSSLRNKGKKQLLITIWGNCDLGLNNVNLWKQCQQSFSNFAKTYGHTNAFLQSNFHDFINREYLNKWFPEIRSWRMQAIEGLGWAGLCAPILLSKGYKKLYVASSISWDYPFKEGATPFLDNNIKFASVSLEHDSFDLSRVEKNELVATLCTKQNLQKPVLKVCIRPTLSGNCCNCDKCLMTIAGFLAIDEPFQEFGFSISQKKAENTIKNFINNFLSRKNIMPMRLWHFQCIQHKIQERKLSGEKLSPFLDWFLSLNISQKMATCPQKRINYRELSTVVEEIKNKHKY